jgi:phage-related protein (TIGR01555 family)
MTQDERNARRRERYAKQKQLRLDAEAGRNALRNVSRLDGFYSSTTGAGITGYDKSTSYLFAENDELADDTLEALYLDNDVAATIVERVVLDSLRGGYDLVWKGSTEELRRDVVAWGEANFDVTAVVKKTRIYSRLFGGGGTFIGSDSGSNFEKPRDPAAPPQFLRSVPSKDLTARSWNADLVDQNFSTVLSYDYKLPTFDGIGETGKPVVGSIVVDASYILPLYGVTTTDDRFRDNDGWGDSVLRRCYEALKQFEMAYGAILNTLAENSIPVYKVEGLLRMLASENADLLQARFQLINAAKSNFRAIVLGEEEDFFRVEAKLQEAANVVLSAMQRVAGSSGQPMTILWGMSPAGLNATGQSDLEIWNQQVAKEQSLELGPHILDVYRALLVDPSSPLGGEVPEDLRVEFPSLWTPSLQDQVNNYAQVAGADAALVAANVLTPEKVASHRSREKNTLFPSMTPDELRSAEEMAELDADMQVVEEGVAGALEGTAGAPVGSPEGLDTPPGSEPQKAALNGAQVKALQDLAIAAADGTLPIETAKAIALASFPLTEETAEAIFSPLPANKFEEKQREPKPTPVNPLAGLGAPEQGL